MYLIEALVEIFCIVCMPAFLKNDINAINIVEYKLKELF